MTKTALALALALAGCSEKNTNYCPEAPDHNCLLIDAPDGDGPHSCTSSSECTGTNKACDTAMGMCVQCTNSEPSACMGTTPICTADSCQACTMHSQCSSAACLPDGTCGDDTNVAYVSGTGGSDTAPCTKAQPCSHVMVALTQGRSYVKIHGTIDESVAIENQNVTLLADPGAQLSHNGGIVVEVKGTSHVVIEDLTIAEPGGTTGVQLTSGGTQVVSLLRVAILGLGAGNGGTGINAQAGTIKMSRCVVSGNLTGGASIIDVDFDITNSLFVANGNGASTIGGLRINPLTTNYVFRFNTVADNNSSAASIAGRGMNCLTAMNVTSVILDHNLASSNCMVDYSLFDTGLATSHNQIGDPAFKSTDATLPLAADYYRIGEASVARDLAEPSGVPVDLDGDARPYNGAFDIGADELAP